MFSTTLRAAFSTLAFLVLALHAHDASAQSATIEGTISDSGGRLIAGATVAIAFPGDPFRQTRSTGTTDASGNYSITVNFSGASQQLRVEAGSPNHAPGRYGFSGSLPCYFNCGVGGEFTVNDGSTVTGIDIALAAGGKISGTITDRATGNPVSGVFVEMLSASFQAYSAPFAGVTSASGTYTPELAVAPGSYYARTTTSANYVDQVWNGNTCQYDVCPLENTDAISVAAGPAATGYDFALQPGATLSGDLAPGNIDKYVYLYNAAGQLLNVQFINGASSPATAWSFDQLAGGSYYVQLGPVSGQTGYLRQLHNGLLCPWSGCERARGSAVSLPAGASLSLPTTTLAEGGQVEGNIIDASSFSAPAGTPANAQLGTYDIIDASGEVAGGGRITSDASGNVSLESSSAVPGGTYYVRTYSEFFADGIGHESLAFSDFIPGYADAVFPDIACAGIDCDLSSATPVNVTVGSTSTITIGIETGSTISGRVTDASGAPIEDAIVQVVDAANESKARLLTDSLGEYAFGGFPSGTYYVRTSMSGSVGPGHGGSANAYFDKVHGASGRCSELLCDPTSGTPIVLDGTTDVTLPDLSVEAGPVITGQIIDVNTGYPIPRGKVEVFDSAGELVGVYKVGFTDATYQTTALPAGTYTLVPQVSPVYSSVTTTGGSSPGPRRQTTSGNGFEVSVGTMSVDANLSVVDRAIDRLFSDRFGASSP